MMFSLGKSQHYGDEGKGRGKLRGKYIRSHKWKLLLDTALDALGVNHETAEDVVHKDEQSVGTEEHLGDVNTANGRVVKCAFHPLCGVGGQEVCVKVRQAATQRGETF